MTEPTREIAWNIGMVWPMYVLFAVAMGVFGFGCWRAFKRWRAGKPIDRKQNLGARLMRVLVEVLFQTRVGRSPVPLIFHGMIFYSFIILTITTLVVMMDMDFGFTLFRGNIYLGLSLAADIGGALVLMGLLIALVRRVITKPKWLETRAADNGILGLLAAIILTGFVVEGLRMALAGDAWAAWSPVGQVFSLPFVGMDEGTGRLVHAVLWWGHLVLAMAFIALIPFTKLFHILTIPANTAFTKEGPRGALARQDLEELMDDDDFDEDDLQLGLNTFKDFNWHERLSLDSCIECGRCEAICPSNMATEPLSPKKVVMSLRDYILAHDAPEPPKSAGAEDADDDDDDDDDDLPAIIDTAVGDETIWYCRTCGACQEVCPANIEHVDTFIDIRRNQTMMMGDVPAEAARALKMMGNLGNPFAGQDERVEWIEKIGAPVIDEDSDEVDVLVWVGCITTFDPDKQRIAEDLFRILDAAGVSYGVLGEEERCCGDPARIMGDENVFQEIAKGQIETFSEVKFKRILTACPHCYNTLAHEYPSLGGKYEVVHHTDFLQELLRSGKLEPSQSQQKKAVYHDPCFLGRYQGIYDSPRRTLDALPGVQLTEMASHHAKSMCCGAGGGHFWMDLEADERINNLRVDQANAAGADTIVTACGFCKQMLDDSVKARDLDERIKVIDVVSLLAGSLDLPEKKPEAETPSE